MYCSCHRGSSIRASINGLLPTSMTVTFIDSNLEAAVREDIGKPEGPIYPSDLEDLISLDAVGQEYH